VKGQIPIYPLDYKIIRHCKNIQIVPTHFNHVGDRGQRKFEQATT